MLNSGCRPRPNGRGVFFLRLEIAAAYAEIDAVVKSLGKSGIWGKGIPGVRSAVIGEVVPDSERHLEHHSVENHQCAGPEFRRN